MYCTWAACTTCAQLIIQSGIGRVVTDGRLRQRTPERWQAEIEHADKLLAETGVLLTVLEGALNSGLRHRFDGQDWEP
jgi:deoxycytidylate deaminase